MLLRGTKSVATVAEFASSTSTGSVFCGDCAAAKFGPSRQANIRTAADGDRLITSLRIVFIRNLRHLSGISTSKTLVPIAYELEQSFRALARPVSSLNIWAARCSGR